ncbi:MAG: squalene/phytoene synthase family protein [Alphaproteobacteria bacterium]|nr:squalene/phytoene synthase family protein [Alphaproteobacteria bacterium]
MALPLSYCGHVVKTQDPDRFLLSMFAPAPCREALWALFAFNHEIARTREVVSETQLGLIRLQWWRDALGAIYDGQFVPEHEVLKPLAGAIKTYALKRDLFETLLYAREFDLEDVRPANLEGLLNYADFTSTPLLRLALEICGGAPELEPVQPVAVNYALAGILRAVPFYARQHRCLLPEDLMNLHGQSLNALYDFKPAQGLMEIVKRIENQRVEGVCCENRFLRASNALALIYLRQIRALGYDVFSPKLLLQPSFKVLRILFSVM